MPTKTKIKRKKTVTPYIEPEIITPALENPKSNRTGLKILVVLVILGLAALAIFKKDLYLAGTVNGMPILKWELTNRTVDRYGNQILDTIVAEKLILSEASKQKIAISNAEISAKVAEIEKSFGPDVKIDEILKFQGITEAEFRSQVKIQAIVDKLLSKEVSISAQEVDQYISSNSAFLSATDPAVQRLEAEQALRNSRLTELFQAWFAKIREQAKIEKFL